MYWIFKRILVINYNKKSLGQNFLIDKNISKKILKLVKIKDRNIIEIGPGKVLSGLVKRINKDVKISSINSQSDIESLNIWMI